MMSVQIEKRVSMETALTHVYLRTHAEQMHNASHNLTWPTADVWKDTRVTHSRVVLPSVADLILNAHRTELVETETVSTLARLTILAEPMLTAS